jgi:hypothetical protein
MFDPTAPLFNNFPFGYLIGLINFIVFYTAYQQDILYISICLNRLTAVWEPFNQQNVFFYFLIKNFLKRWKKWWKWNVLFAHIIPIPLTIHILISRGLYLPLNRYNPGIQKLPIILNFDLWKV